MRSAASSRGDPPRICRGTRSEATASTVATKPPACLPRTELCLRRRRVDADDRERSRLRQARNRPGQAAITPRDRPPGRGVRAFPRRLPRRGELNRCARVHVEIDKRHIPHGGYMPGSAPARTARDIDHAVVRFAGDSGDGMQLTGTEFTREAALHGNDLATFPDFPAEIRAPAGTT